MDQSIFDNLHYNEGFGNAFKSEALPGAVPEVMATQHPPYGLYPEQLNGTTFTAPREQGPLVWMFRTQPFFKHQTCEKIENHDLQGSYESSNTTCTPAVKLFKALQPPEGEVDFVAGIHSLVGTGTPDNMEGMAVHLYAFNKSMVDKAFVNADGDFLIVPQLGTLHIQTELGLLTVKPKEICVMPAGIYYSVRSPDPFCRGYICEIFHNHFNLPPLGVLGKNGNANPLHFQAPVAYYEDVDKPYQVVRKFVGQLFSSTYDFSPFNVVGWAGNYYPYKYDLLKFQPFSCALTGHADPSTFTVLTAPTARAGVAVVDFIFFGPRWVAGENSISMPYPHRNSAYEVNGVIEGAYEPFQDGGCHVAPFLSPHGITKEALDSDLKRDGKPFRVGDESAWVMFESGLMLRETSFAQNPKNQVVEFPNRYATVGRRWNPNKKDFSS